jgi:hypothetical protein
MQIAGLNYLEPVNMEKSVSLHQEGDEGICEPASICPRKTKETVCEPASICPQKVGGGAKAQLYTGM